MEIRRQNTLVRASYVHDTHFQVVRVNRAETAYSANHFLILQGK